MSSVPILGGDGATYLIGVVTIAGVQYQSLILTDGLGNPVEETPTRYLNLNSTGQVVKASAGRLYTIEAFNLNTSGVPAYLKFYDKATAATNADTPKWTWQLMPGFPIMQRLAGLIFTLGLSVRATLAATDADTTDPAANEVVLNLGTK